MIAHGASRPAMITAVRDGVAVHPDGERIRVRGGADQWAAGLLCRVREAATMALFGLTDGRIVSLPSSAQRTRSRKMAALAMEAA